MDLRGQNIYVLDLECLYGASECIRCHQAEENHFDPPTGHDFEKIGWNRHAELGLSIACYFSYRDMAFHWLDTPTLEATVRHLVASAPCLVSWNGMQFDGPLMCALLRQDATPEAQLLCDAFSALWAKSYDILNEIYLVDPARKFERGLNSLGACSAANGYGEKEMDGASAPLLWRAGRYAEVIAYNFSDVLKTRRLFEQIVQTGSILRGDGQPIALPMPRGLAQTGEDV